MTADANGRWPTVFVPYTTSFDYKTTTSGGTQLSYPTQIPNSNPITASSSVTTSSTQLFQTGMTMYTFTNASQSGFVRLNGRTMGNGASGATERANADTADLFAHLYNNLSDAIAAVSAGRGANAAADYAANKTITLPDMRGATPVGLDTMGNAAGSFLTAVTFSAGNSSTAGSPGGENTHTLITAELASHTHGPGTLATGAGSAHNHGVTDTHTHSYLTGGAQGATAGGVSVQIQPAANTATTGVTNGGSIAINNESAHTHNVTGGVTASNGSGTAHNVVQKCRLVTWHIKL